MDFSFNFRDLIHITKRSFKAKGFSIILIAIFITLTASTVFAQDSVQPTQDTHLLSKLLIKFQTETAKWEPIIRGYSLSIFSSLLIIDFGWMGIRYALKRASVEELIAEAIMLIFFASLMLSVIFHYKDWANSIISLFSQIGVETGASNASPTAVFGAGISILGNLWAEASIWSPITSSVYALCAVAIIITFSLITAQIIMVKCEAFIVLNAGTILLGLGGAKVTRDYAINFLRYALSVAMKLFIMQLLIGLSMTFITDFTKVNAKSAEEIFIVLGASIIILALTMSLPDIVSGIVNGTHVSSGNSLSSAVSAVSTATIAAMQGVRGAAGGAVGAKRGVDAIKEAASFANSAGKTGLGKLGHMGGTGIQAARENLSQGKSSGIRSSVKAQHEAFKMQDASQDSESGDKS